MKLKFGRYDYAAFLAFSAYASCSVVIPLTLVSLARDLHFPLEDGGMASGGMLHIARSAAIVLSLLLCGMLAGRIGKRKSMGLASLLMGTGILLCSMATSHGFLMPMLMICGFGEGLCEGISTPFVHDLHKESPGGYVNIAHSFWSVGIGLCVIIVGALLAIGCGWRWIMSAIGIFTLFTSITFLWRENPQKKYPEEAAQTSPAGVWKNSIAISKNIRFWIYCLGMFLGAGSEFCLTFWASSFIQLNFNASAWIGGLGTAALALGMFLGRSGFGRFVPQNKLLHLLLATGIGGIPVTLLIYFLQPDTFSSPALTMSALFFLLFLSGICVAPFWPSLQVYGVDRLPHLDSTMLFVYFSSIGVPGCGFFTWLMGFLGDKYGLHRSFLMIPVTLICFSALILLEGFVFKKIKK